MSSTWVFKQLGGDENTLTLSGHAAPHGGSRRASVIEPAIQIREDESYLGVTVDVPPVRALFGPKFPPVKLEGRFSDGYGGKGFAQNKHLEVAKFVADAQPVSVVWDDLVAFVGLIKQYTPKIEAPWDIAWELEILRDSDDLLAFDPREDKPLRQPVDFVNQIILFSTIANQIPKVPPTLKGDIFDSLDSLVSNLNEITSAAASVAGSIGDMERATFAELRRFRLGLQQINTAVVRLRNAYDQLKIDAALETASANEAVAFWDVQTSWSTSSLQIIQEVAEASRAVATAEAGRTLAFYTARESDTWESISRQFFKSSDRADDIRAANGIEAGVSPNPGSVYRIPT